MQVLRDLQSRLESVDRSSIARALVLLVGVTLTGASIAWAVREFANHQAWPDDTDMSIYLEAADAAARGANPYAGSAGDYHRYPYPPLFADFLAVLVALFGDRGAALVWMAVSAAALIGAVVMLTRSFGLRLPLPWVALACGVLFLGRAARADLYHGQLNFVLLFLLVAGFSQWRAGRGHWASALWAIMICFKPFLGIVVLFQLQQRDWRGAALTFVFSGCLFLLSFLPLYNDIIGSFWGWRETTQHYASPEWAINPLNHSFYGLFLRLFVENEYSRAWLHAPALVAVGVAVAAALALAAIVRLPRPNPSAPASDTAVLLCLGVVVAAIMSVGPITEGDHLFFPLPGVVAACVLTWRRVAEGARNAGLWLLTSAAWGGVLVLPLYPKRFLLHFVDAETWRVLEGPGTLLSAWPSFFLIAAALLSAHLLWRESRDGAVK